MSVAAVFAGAAAVALAGALAQLHTPLGRRTTSAGQPAGAAHQARGHLAGFADRPVGRHVIVAILSWALGALVSSPIKGLVVAAAAVAVSKAQVRRAERARRAQCETAVPALARSLADGLRGGASVRGAFGMVAGDRSVPRGLRQVVHDEAAALAVGAPLSTALTNLASAGGASMRLLCGTVAMHLNAGGALATQLDRIATDGESARKVEEERRSATAQARATVRVVAALPLLAMGGAQLASPGFLSMILANPVALALLALGLILELVAVLAARAIVGPAT